MSLAGSILNQYPKENQLVARPGPLTATGRLEERMTNGATPVPESFTVIGLTPAAVVDGGALEAGAGLLLLVRNALNRLQEDEVLEVGSAERGLREDLPAWCRLTSNDFLVGLDAGDHTRYFIRKGARAARWGRPDWGVRLPRRASGAIDLRSWLAGAAARVPQEAP